MKTNISFVLICVLLLIIGYLFVKVYNLENNLKNVQSIVNTHEGKMIYLDKVTEVVEDCMEYKDFAECKQNYPKYAEMFR